MMAPEYVWCHCAKVFAIHIFHRDNISLNMAAGNLFRNTVYLDNNATTEMPAEVRREMTLWTNQGNPSAGYASARATRSMMSNFRNYIGQLIGANVCCDEDRDSDPVANADMREDKSRFRIIITSGASEANAAVITGVVAEAAKGLAARLVLPNIVISAVEHKSVIACANGLRDQGRATVTVVPVDLHGVCNPDDVAAAISATTCIVCVMAANNETGAINDIAAIGAVCRARGVHYHCDGVQAFGKFPPKSCCYDSLAVSFHKLHGPPGVGALCVRIGTKMDPLIWGSQNEGLRGGTENVPGIAAAYMGTRLTMSKRSLKNDRMMRLKQYIVFRLSTAFNVASYEQYVGIRQHNAAIGTNKVTVHNVLPGAAARALVDAGLAAPLFSPIPIPPIMIVTISTMNQCLPGTLLLSVVKETKPDVCNTKIKESLERAGIIVSIGSACNTADPKASHVLYAIGADEYVRRGCLRISLGDETTRADVDRFLDAFIRIVTAVRDA